MRPTLGVKRNGGIIMETKKTTMELLVELQTATDEAVEAMNGGKPAAETDPLKDKVDAALDAYNASATADAYEAWNAQEKPVEAILRDRFVPGIKRVQFRTDKETGLMTATIKDAETRASLVKYAGECGYGNFAEGRDWWTKVQALAFIMADAFNKELCSNSQFVYEVEKAATLYDFGKDANPASKTSCVKALQACFDSILPGVRANSHDVAYIRASMTRNGGVGKIIYGGTHKMADFVADAMHQRLVGEEFVVTT